jgi:hypothetical protein
LVERRQVPLHLVHTICAVRVATEPSRFEADKSPGYECHQHNRENRSPNEVEGSSIQSGAHRLTIVTVQAKHRAHGCRTGNRQPMTRLTHP